jgi:protein SCO1/2
MVAATAALTACGSDDAPSAATGDAAGDAAGDDGKLSGYTVDPPVSVADVTLPDVSGTDLAMPARPGGLHLVYFGYTSCPDVCPTTMSDLRRAVGTLPDDRAALVDLSMVTVDPDRDTPVKLADYVHNFFPEGRALRTDDKEALRAAASAFGASYDVSVDDEGTVEVSHTAEVYAVDDQGTIVLQWPFGTDHESIAEDLTTLLDEPAAT